MARKSVQRRIHDAYGRLASTLGKPPEWRELPPAAHLVQTVPVQTAGEVMLDNSLEAGFFGLPERTATYAWPDQQLFHLRDVWLAGDQENVFFKSGELFAICQDVSRQWARKVRRPIKALARKLGGLYFHLGGPNHDSRGHFILHHLPKLIAARDVLKRFPEAKILVAPRHVKWQTVYLQALGIPPDRIVEGSDGTLHVEELLYVPTLYGARKLSDPAQHRALNLELPRALLPALPPMPGLKQPPIFISRADAPDKRLANEDHIVQLAGEILGGIEVVHLRNHSLAEQIRKFHQAPVIIGAMGQGLTNINFTSGKTLVVIERGADLPDRSPCLMFRNLALVCGNRAIRFHSGTTYQGPKRDWTFPEPKFRQQLTRLRDEFPR